MFPCAYYVRVNLLFALNLTASKIAVPVAEGECEQIYFIDSRMFQKEFTKHYFTI